MSQPYTTTLQRWLDSGPHLLRGGKKIAAVHLTDKRPIPSGEHWLWSDGPEHWRGNFWPEHLPVAFGFLVGGLLRSAPGIVPYRLYDRREYAEVDLSWALLTWARTQVDLAG